MASRIMHLAIVDKIAEKTDIADYSRFRFGCIMPDAYSDGLGTAVSHFKTRVYNNCKSTYRLAYFRELYAKELACDSLYTGYYMHLIQDMLFRRFVYSDYKWDPVPQGNTERLHNDYRLLNSLLIKKYGISDEFDIPIDIQNEKLFEIYPFDLKQLMLDIRSDFSEKAEGEAFFFTSDMADEFISLAAEACILELGAFKTGKFVIDENEYAWCVHI